MAETIKSIIDWHETTFPDATLEGQMHKFDTEHSEFIETERTDIMELADMFIVACGIARFGIIEAMRYFERFDNNFILSAFSSKELEKAINEKMEINRQRKWNFENGVYQHKEEK